MGAFAGGSAAELPSLEEELAQVFVFKLSPTYLLGSFWSECFFYFYIGAVAAAASEATTGVHNKRPKWGGDFLFLIFWAGSSQDLFTQVSNTSMGTDTDTQFLMSSDSGSKVQVRREIAEV